MLDQNQEATVWLSIVQVVLISVFTDTTCTGRHCTGSATCGIESETRGATLCGGVLGESLMRTWSQSCVSPLRLKRGRADKGTCCCCLGQESTCVLLHMDCGEVELSVQESSTHIVTTNTKLSQSTLWNKHKLRCKSDVVETNYPNILLRLTQNQPEIASF